MLRTVEGGLRIVDEGGGRPVVLLHGFPDRAELWRDVGPHLQAGGLRTLALDLPGFGESPAPAGRAEYGVENVAGQVLGALDALGVSERVDVVGHDWGAVLGWVLCLRHPDRVRRFVALSVGHPRAYINAGLEQKRKGTYMLKWQIPRLAEHGLSEDDFRRLRAFMPRHPDIEQVVTDLRRPGRLTAGLNWYRANYLQNVFTAGRRAPRRPSASGAAKTPISQKTRWSTPAGTSPVTGATNASTASDTGFRSKPPRSLQG